MQYLNGYYKVDGEIIPNKVHAVIKASELKKSAQWWYYDEIFEEANKKYTHRIGLLELYKQRAQQLRDSYDYLVLNYSGGSDSHNVLQVFLKNNIKIDAIYVQWPESLVDKGLYIPNSQDKSNSNFHSEWDLVIKKDLEWISKNFPDTIIEIGDWTKTVKENFYTDDLFSANVSNLPSIARAQKQNTFSHHETMWANQGKRVASIFGVDKTPVVKFKDKWYFFFMDTCMMAQPNPENPNGVEYFYHTPAFPEIAIEQATLLKNWFKQHPEKEYLVQAPSERFAKNPELAKRTYREFYKELEEIAEIIKLVCYPFWDFNRFQAEKPFAVLEGFKMGTRGWDNILTALPDFDRVQQKWEYNWKSYLSMIDQSFLRNRDTLQTIRSKAHIINH